MEAANRRTVDVEKTFLNIVGIGSWFVRDEVDYSAGDSYSERCDRLINFDFMPLKNEGEC